MTFDHPRVLAILRTLFLCATVFIGFNAGVVHAQSASSVQQAAQVALQQNGGMGKVLSVSTETDNQGRRVFAVRILTNGRVRTVRIASTK